MVLDHPWAFGPLDQMSLFCHQICDLTSQRLAALLMWRPSLEKKIFNIAIAGGIKNEHSQDSCRCVCKISFQEKVSFVEVGAWEKAEGQGLGGSREVFMEGDLLSRVVVSE